MLETRGGRGCSTGTTQRGEEHFSVMIIAGDFDCGQGDHADPGIFELGSNELSEILLNLIGDAAKPGWIFRHVLNSAEVGLKRACRPHRRLQRLRAISTTS